MKKDLYRKSNWQQLVKKRPNDLFRAYLVAAGSHQYQNLLDFKALNKSLISSSNLRVDYYLYLSDLQALTRQASYYLNEEYFQKYQEVYQKTTTSLEESSLSLPSFEEVTFLPNKTLYQLLSRFFGCFKTLTPFMISPHIFQKVLTDNLEEALRKRGKEDLISQLTLPQGPTFEERFKQELAEFINRLPSNLDLKEVPSLLLNFSQRWFFYSRTEDWRFFYPFRVDQLVELINHLKKHPDELLDYQNIYLKQKKALNKARKLVLDLKFNSQEKLWLKFLQYVIWQRTDRLEYFRKACYYSMPLIREVVHRMDLDEYVGVITPLELLNFLQKGTRPTLDELKKRQERFIVLFDYGKAKIETGQNLKKWQEFLNTAKARSSILHGWGASPGKAQGRVKIVMDPFQAKDFKKGDILVTNMTNPNYVLLMQKASAIITDEGGVTCHAAIVARELGIPCVVGTQVATEVLRNGEVVKVDGKKGLVVIEDVN